MRGTKEVLFADNRVRWLQYRDGRVHLIDLEQIGIEMVAVKDCDYLE